VCGGGHNWGIRERVLIHLQAIGVVAAENGGVKLLIKKSDKHHQPAASTQSTTFGAKKGSRKYVSPTRKDPGQRGATMCRNTLGFARMKTRTTRG